MCDYVNKNELIEPREIFNEWISNVQSEIKKEYGITFSYNPIGSGSRNMVIRRCDNDYFDLDFQIVMQSIPDDMDWDGDCKEFKDIFRNTFNKYKPQGFKDCKDRSQSLRTKNLTLGFGFDIIITCFDNNDNFYILFNKKDTNGANNEDYEWSIRKDMNKYRERLSLIEGPEMWNYLRNIYKNKRHKHMHDQEPKKHSYQLLNEAVVETLVALGIKNYPR